MPQALALRHGQAAAALCRGNNPPLVNYLVILEANDNPYAVQDRFDKEIIDHAFDQSRSMLLSSPAEDLLSDPIWARTALHLAHYFRAINQQSQAIIYYEKAQELGIDVTFELN